MVMWLSDFLKGMGVTFTAFAFLPRTPFFPLLWAGSVCIAFAYLIQLGGLFRGRE